MRFESLNIIEPILRSLKEEGYTTPTPVQEQAIPIVLGGTDLLGCAQTGTGKTAAFAVPILQLLLAAHANEKKRKIRSLIVTPTRELAIQIDDSFRAYGRHTGLTSTVIFGGVAQGPQTTILQKGVDILVATPGRLLDLIGQGYISLKDIEIFVLDEADRMLDMGFIHDVKKIIALLPHERQSLFFSATMEPEIIKLANTILRNPSKVMVTPSATTVDTVQQYVFFVDKGNKNALLVDLLKNRDIRSALVFTRTKHGADKVVKVLLKNDIKAEAIHGNKGQNVRQRALANFKEKTTRVLVATDIAARGIDVDDMQWVINFELPNVPETYVHRIGRTARAGATGTAYSFCDAEEKAYLKDIEKLIKFQIPVWDDHEYPLIDHNPVKAPKQEYRRPEGRRTERSGAEAPSKPAHTEHVRRQGRETLEEDGRRKTEDSRRRTEDGGRRTEDGKQGRTRQPERQEQLRASARPPQSHQPARSGQTRQAPPQESSRKPERRESSGNPLGREADRRTGKPVVILKPKPKAEPSRPDSLRQSILNVFRKSRH
jgi:ATP-dependent RNA helicase RhlE